MCYLIWLSSFSEQASTTWLIDAAKVTVASYFLSFVYFVELLLYNAAKIVLGTRRGGGATVSEPTLRGKQIWRCVCRGQTRYVTIHGGV